MQKNNNLNWSTS